MNCTKPLPADIPEVMRLNNALDGGQVVAVGVLAGCKLSEICVPPLLLNLGETYCPR